MVLTTKFELVDPGILVGVVPLGFPIVLGPAGTHDYFQQVHRLGVHRVAAECLQGLGAVAVKNSVYVLPRSDQAFEDFQWVRREIVDGIEPLPKKEKDMAVVLAQRQTLVDLFGLETSATDKLKSALFLLAPVFRSIVVTITGAGAK